MTQFDTNFAFTPGKMTVLLDGGAGSSGKGKLASFVGQNADNWQFCCNTFMSNAAHWVVLDDGAKYLYQSLNSVAHLEQYEKMYIAGGAVTELSPLLREIEEHNITPRRLGIHPIVAIVQKKDIDYERGVSNFEGDRYDENVQSDCMKLGSTLHGVGAARARRILRRSDVLLARDVPELKPFICWTDKEMMDRLEAGQAGMLEIAQGYQLGYLSQFYPKSTSRNCSVAAGLDDACLPPYVAHNVIINFRTFPIRVNNNKFVHADTGEVLTSDDMSTMKAAGEEDKIKVLKGDSGACYDDQREVTWEDVTAWSGIQDIDPTREIREKTSLTKLERRVYTFSRINLDEAIRFNRASGKVYISVNFINYVDAELEGVRGGREQLTHKGQEWVDENIHPTLTSLCENQSQGNAALKFLGTGARTNDMIVL